MSKIILVSVYNYGCIDLALNFLESLKRVNLANKHISYVTDEKSFDIIKEKGYQVELFKDFSITEEKMSFEKKDFVKLCYIRYAIFHKLLDSYDYVWCLDVDTVVLGDIVSYFLNSEYVNCDITYQLDLDNIYFLCGGCFVIKSSSITKNFVKHIFESRDNEVNEQVYFNIFFERLGKRNPIKIGTFSMFSFINGGIYFGDKYQDYKQLLKESTEPIYFVHANYMVGIDTKIKALKEKGLWYL
jgi:lipopolysaccharide biosynthesis glycosyltransferase